MVLVCKDINQRFNINTYHNNLIKNRGINIHNSIKEEIKKEQSLIFFDKNKEYIIEKKENEKKIYISENLVRNYKKNTYNILES